MKFLKKRARKRVISGNVPDMIIVRTDDIIKKKLKEFINITPSRTDEDFAMQVYGNITREETFIDTKLLKSGIEFADFFFLHRYDVMLIENRVVALMTEKTAILLACYVD